MKRDKIDRVVDGLLILLYFVIAFCVIVLGLGAYSAHAQYGPPFAANTCVGAGGGGNYHSPTTADDKIGPTGVYWSTTAGGQWAGFADCGGPIWWWTGGDSANGILIPTMLKSCAQGVFKGNTQSYGFCSPVIIDAGQFPVFMGACGPVTGGREILKPDACGLVTGQYPVNDWGAVTSWSDLQFGLKNGDATHPAADIADVGLLFNGIGQEFVGGGIPDSSGTFHTGGMSAHVPNISKKQYSGTLRQGQQVLLLTPLDGLTVGSIGTAVTRVIAGFGSGGFPGDPNYQENVTQFDGSIQSYLTVTGMGIRATPANDGAMVVTLGSCPQVIGRIIGANAVDDVYFVQTDWTAMAKEQDMLNIPNSQRLSWQEAGSQNCRADSGAPTTLPPMNWNPGPTTNVPTLTAWLANQNHQMDLFLHQTDSTGKTWTDIIQQVGGTYVNSGFTYQHIQTVGAADNDDLTGSQTGGGNVYFTIQYNCSGIANGCQGSALTQLLKNILNATNASGVSVRNALTSFGLPVPPTGTNAFTIWNTLYGTCGSACAALDRSGNPIFVNIIQATHQKNYSYDQWASLGNPTDIGTTGQWAGYTLYWAAPDVFYNIFSTGIDVGGFFASNATDSGANAVAAAVGGPALE